MQKGAAPEIIQEMDRGFVNFIEVAKKTCDNADSEFSGAGAAGGLGFVFLTFTHPALESGIEIVLDETRFEDYVKGADIIVTREGRLDGQTLTGRVLLALRDW